MAGNLCPHGGRGIELRAIRSVSGHGQAAASVSGETSAMRSLGQCELEHAPGRGTEMSLSVARKTLGKILRNQSFPPAHEERNKKDNILWLKLPSVTSQVTNVCYEQPIEHAIYGLKTGPPSETQEQLIVNGKLALKRDTSRSFHCPIAIPTHCWYRYNMKMGKMRKNEERGYHQRYDSHHCLQPSNTPPNAKHKVGLMLQGIVTKADLGVPEMTQALM